MIFLLFIMEMTNTFLDEMIHITHKCIVHLHGHQSKMVPIMEPYILADFSNGIMFRRCTYWSTNDICNHCFPYHIHNHHIDKKNLVLTNHVKINS